MDQYIVTGMSCAACSARVEKAVSAVPGVSSCSVSLLTNSMGVEGTASPEQIIAAVEAAGYGASERYASRSSSAASEDEELLQDRATPVLIRRLIASIGFLLALMYISMGHMMWDWPLPRFLAEDHVSMGLAQLLLAAAVMVINQRFFISGVRGLLHRAPNMDTLVAMGSAASFIYSTVVLFLMSGAQSRGDTEAVSGFMHDFYFEAAAMILTLITVGKLLEAHSKGKTTNALKSLMHLSPKTATLLSEGKELTVPIEQVKPGDIFLVRPGESIPVDGTVLEGESAVNEAALTGESVPSDKSVGSAVSAATINQSGFLKCKATRVGQDTTLAQIIRMVSDAAATKAPIAKAADRVSGVFVPTVIVISIITLAAWLLAGESFGFALARAVSVLVISCPCALGLATPVAIMVGSGLGAKNGILFKTAVSLEETGKVCVAALDKTGTITRGEPTVTDLIPADGETEDSLLSLAASMETLSEHPLARAILRAASKRGLSLEVVSGFRALPGHGLEGVLNDEKVCGGNSVFIGSRAAVPEALVKKSEVLSEDGKTPLFFSRGGKCLGIIAVADVLKEDSPQAVSELQRMGIRVVMLTGDNERTARAIGRQAGVDEVIAGVLPDGKENVIRELQKRGKVLMVGDGINDAPALTRADVGLAIGAGADVAIDAADVVLTRSTLLDVPAAVRLSRATLRNIHENLFWAFFYNAIGIPLAAGVWIPLLHWQLNPMFGAAAMSLSSFCVVTNALRLNLFRMHDASRDRAIKQHYTRRREKENKDMTKTLKIEGMMCSHCEARVKKALEAVEGVTEAQVSHENGTAIVSLSVPVSDEILKKAVEDQDYKVVG